MLNKIKSFFMKKKENGFDENKEVSCDENTLFKDEKIILKGTCTDCIFKDYCKDSGNWSEICDFIEKLPEDWDDKKETILIIDDNEGLVSFLWDDIQYIHEKGVIDKNKYNFLLISGKYAAFKFKVLQEKYKKLNIKFAIIDINFGGTNVSTKGNIKYTGIDVFESIQKYNKNFSYIFFTGNKLNAYIKSNQRIIEKFEKLTGESISEHVLFKASVDMDSRRKLLIELFFDRRFGKNEK